MGVDILGRRSHLRHRFAAIAMASALGIAASAPMAAIVDSGPVSLSAFPNLDGLYLNFVTGASANAPVAGWDFNPYFTSGFLTFYTSDAVSDTTDLVGVGTVVFALGAGTTIGPASTFADTGVVTTMGSTLRTTAAQYVGVRFKDEATSAIYYGYVQLQTTAATGVPATIMRYVYENTGAPIVIPSGGGGATVLMSAASRRTHGAAGTFDLPLLLAPLNPTTEPRQGPVQTVVFTFNNAITGATAAITEGTAVAGVPTFSGNDVIVGLTGVADQQYVTVSLTNVSDSLGGTGGSASVRLGFLLGDVNQNRAVAVSDLGLVNQQLAQPVTAANYLKDVNASGSLTVADKGITNANLTHSLPPP